MFFPRPRGKALLHPADRPHLLLHGEFGLAWVHCTNAPSQVSPAALSQTLEFLYTGALPSRAALHLADLDKVRRHALTSFNNQVGSLLEVPHLLDYVANMRSKEDFLNSEVTEQMVATISHQLEDIILGRRLFSDIEVTSSITHLHCLPQFALDDGKVAAHKPILMARCDMMQVNHSDLDFCCWLHLADYCFLQRDFFSNFLLSIFQAMFSDAFLEGSARCVRFPGVSSATFRSLLHYLYTDTVPRVTPATAMPVIELANRCVT